MPIIKLTVSELELELLRRWANGSAVATLAKHAVLLKARTDMGTLAVPSKYPLSTLPVPSVGTPATNPKSRVPLRYPPGTQCGPDDSAENPGTDRALLRSGEEKSKRRRREEEEVREEKKRIKRGSGGPRIAPLDVTEEIISDLNHQAGTSYRATGKKLRELVAARMAEGYTVADFLEVHRKQSIAWREDPKMAQFLRPITLYSSKFEAYLGAPEPKPYGYDPKNQMNQQDYTAGANPDGTF